MNILRRQRNGYKEQEFLLIGNGPSARNITPSQVEHFQLLGGHVGVLNDFYKSELATMISPDYYFLVDGNYWSSEHQNLEASKYESGDQSLREFFFKNKSVKLVQPLEREKYDSNHCQYLFIDTYNIQGVGNFHNPTNFWSYPHSVALIAIGTAKFLGYKRLYFAGLDFSHFLNFVVSDMNTVSFMAKGAHFFEEKLNATTSPIIDLSHTPIRNYGDVHYAAWVHYKDFSRIAKHYCVNIGQDQTNDVCPRACLVKLSG